MLEVIQGFFLADAEELGDFPQIQWPFLQSPGDFLPQGPRFFVHFLH